MPPRPHIHTLGLHYHISRWEQQHIPLSKTLCMIPVGLITFTHYVRLISRDCDPRRVIYLANDSLRKQWKYADVQTFTPFRQIHSEQQWNSSSWEVIWFDGCWERVGGMGVIKDAIFPNQFCSAHTSTVTLHETHRYHYHHRHHDIIRKHWKSSIYCQLTTLRPFTW